MSAAGNILGWVRIEFSYWVSAYHIEQKPLWGDDLVFLLVYGPQTFITILTLCRP
jgi:hypothetical protein